MSSSWGLSYGIFDYLILTICVTCFVMKYFRAVGSDDNEYFRAHHNLAMLLYEKFNEDKKAQKHFLKAIEINEKH